MKETKKTYVPVPGSKSKSKTKDVPAKAHLSKEFIGSDDDSPAEQALRLQPKTTIAVHRAHGTVKPKEKASARDAAMSKPQPEAKPAPKKPAPKQVVTQAQADELSTSEQTDDDDAPTRDIQTKLPGSRASVSLSDSSSDSGSSGDEMVVNGASQTASLPAHAPPSQPQPHAVEFRPTQTFVPPKGFSAVSGNEKTTSRSARIFDNLDGKQIWHITAPVGVSLTDLKEIAMDSAMNGGPVLQHKGTSYGFTTSHQGEDGACEVMVPSKNGYKAVSTSITQSLRLQAAVQLPKLSSLQADQNTGSEAAASITRSTIRAPRPQLKGLKMRFLPTGFGAGDAGTLGESDSEGETRQATAGLGMPNELNLPSRKVKRKHNEANGDGKAESPSKKHKKPRTAEHDQRKEQRRAKKMQKRAREATATKS